MKQNTVLIAVIALLIGGIIGYSLIDSKESDMYGMDGMDHTMMDADDRDSDDMPMGNMDGMDHSMMMVSSEREFVTGMIPHHQEAANTAKEVLARGGSTEAVRTLALNIIEAQELEITLLKQWHLDWYGEAYVAADSYQPMMRDLSQLSGALLDERFLQDMIPHHMGAIMMAQSVRPYIEHQEIADMADAIMETQTAEIDLMRNLLQTI
jgi:uncharacterized protein (DUF305 family)